MSVVIPTRNEALNVPALLARLTRSLEPGDDILLVDDGTDDLPDVVQRESRKYRHRIRVIRRDEPSGGLGGAVTLGMQQARGDIVVVCDGDLQHPPETIPSLVDVLDDAEVAVASRYRAGGDNDGLSGSVRRFVSRATGLLSRMLFPGKLRGCSDPMSGFFAVRRESIELDLLRPAGFKILLEILLRCGPLRIREVPYVFAARTAGESHASMREGFRFLGQLTRARVCNRAALFLAVGASGVVPNLAIMAALHRGGMSYVAAGVIGTQVGIVWNFVGAELLVWRDDRVGQWERRFAKFVMVGETDLLRLPFVVLLVELLDLDSLVASGLTFAAAFMLRFTLADKIVYRRAPVPAVVAVPAAPAEAA